MQHELHTALVERWLDVAFEVQDSWKLEFHLLQTNHLQLLEGPVVLPKALQTPFFFFFSSSLTPPQPSGLTCRRDLLYLHHPCPRPVWVAIPLCTQGGHHYSRILTTNCPFSPAKLSFLSFILLHKTRTHRTMLTNYPELGQDRKSRETKGTWEGKGDSCGSLI